LRDFLLAANPGRGEMAEEDGWWRMAKQKQKPIKIVGRPLGLKPGYAPDKLNQLVDELAGEDFCAADRPD